MTDPHEIAERIRRGAGYGSYSKADLFALARAFLAQQPVIDAARGRVKRGHNDTCDWELGERRTVEDGGYPCTCGHDALVSALAAAPPEATPTLEDAAPVGLCDHDHPSVASPAGNEGATGAAAPPEAEETT